MKKQPLISIIIPTKNSQRTLGACLISIKKQNYKNIEVIVVDNNSVDKTKLIASKYADLVLDKGPERSAQRNFGAKKAKGDYLFFIDSDMELNKNVVKEAVEKLDNKNKKIVVVPEKSFGIGFWAKCKSLERSFYLKVKWIEAARFFDKDIFWKFNGYDEKNTGTEDYDLPQRIKTKLGNDSESRINSFIYHNEGELNLITTLKKKFYYAQKLKQYSSKEDNKDFFVKQASLLNRYMLFFSKPRKIFFQPDVFCGMILMKTLEFFAGGIGYVFNKKR
jgi:glycosyltransferase involved in cell wall biosynthesis